MRKASRFLLILLKNSFIVSVIGLLLGLIGGPGSFFELVFGMIGFYVAIITINLFFIHLLVTLLAFIFERNSSN